MNLRFKMNNFFNIKNFLKNNMKDYNKNKNKYTF